MNDFDLGEELQKSDVLSEVLAIVDLDPITREQERNRISEQYDIRKSTIDQYIKELKKQESKINKTINDKSFYKNKELLKAIKNVKKAER